MSKPGFKFLIDLPVRNHWENVDLLRTSILNCFTAIFSELDGVHAFATVAAELLENAIKYGQWRDPSAKLHLRVWGDDDAAHVEVENPVDATSEDTRELLRTIDWLKTFPSAEHAYRAKLLEAATAPTGVSRLGLARIAYEGGCELCAIIDGDVLRVTSVTKLQA
ncbi:MAG TPA: hypothetical protein VM925_37225 [Labilithrix sp.]|nr:hypothetical protein [Labilithrix sp.]